MKQTLITEQQPSEVSGATNCETAECARIADKMLSGLGYPAARVAKALDLLMGKTPTVSDDGEWKTRSEVCEALKISPTTFWRLKVPGHRVGGRQRYKLAEVVTFMESGVA